MIASSRAASILTVLAVLTAAQTSFAAEKLRMTLDWTFQGPQSIYTYAADKGYFADEGIDITIDRGAGSAEAITRVGSGTYDVAVGDINSMMEYNVKNNQLPPLIAVMMIYDRVPLCVVTLDPKIREPKDLEGKRVVTSPGAADFRLFPLLARKTNIDTSKMIFVNVQPTMREALMVRGEADASTGFYHTSYLTLKSIGAPVEKLKALMYYDYGIKIYGNAIVVTKAFAASKPEVVKAFNRAVARALREVSNNPELAMPSLKKRDGTVNTAIEAERLKVFLDMAVKTPYVRENGFGDVDQARLVEAIDQASEALELARKPAPAEVFTTQYLPSKEQRTLQPAD
jgi:NitT/TauT family transport system substrate-binding protein